MSILTGILEHNRKFVESGAYKAYQTDRLPIKKLVVLTCMDTRLTELLPRAMNLANGDAKIIKNAGALVSHPFGSVMRSILVAVYELGAQEICVVGHHGCGMAGLNCASLIQKIRDRGISDDVLQTLKHSGVDLERWLVGFNHPRDGVLQSINTIRHHPLLPKGLAVHGMLISPETGALEVVEMAGG
jgi:carbonic anhydrase